MSEDLVVGLGEVLWDVLPAGEKIGGAPINFAYHVNALGGRGVPVSTLGDDERGRRALEELKKRDLPLDAISIDLEHPTGYVQANVDEAGVAKFVFPDDVAWDNLRLNARAMEYAGEARVVCFGSLAQRSTVSREAIRLFLDSAPGALKVFDLNLRQNFYSQVIIEPSLFRADILKISDDEFPVLAKMFGVEGATKDALGVFVERFDLQLSVLTRGGEGSLLLGKDDCFDHPGVATTLSDTIGAGDSFTASTILGYLLGHSLEQISDHANRLAAYVCTQAGAMPRIPEELRLV